MKPCETICTMPPSMPSTAPLSTSLRAMIMKAMKKPSVTKPMCAIDE